jgi:hypothetical protein
MASQSLLDQVREVARFKHFSIRTEEAYVHTIKRYILFHNKQHPSNMGPGEIRAYLSHLATDGGVTASTQNVALAALYFCIVMCYRLICRQLKVSNEHVDQLSCQWYLRVPK